MLFHQPGYPIGVCGGKTKARAKPARDLGSRDRMVLAASFGNVMKERPDIERCAMSNTRKDLTGERVLFSEASGLYLAQDAHRAQEMLVDRVVMIHRKLHHANDASEIWNKSPEHSRLVHSPKDDF